MQGVLGIQKIERLIESINQEAIDIGKIDPVFNEIHTSPRNYTCSEAGFLRTLSWLYMLYYESGKGEMGFIIEKFEIYNIDSEKLSQKHHKEIRILRTAFQHNFDPEASRNIIYKSTTENWFLSAINKKECKTNEDWEKSLSRILNDAVNLLSNIYKTTLLIKKDEFRDSVTSDWNRTSSRNFQPHDFDPIIQIVSQEFGLLHFDATKFRKQNIEVWAQDLKRLTSDFNFKVEAKRLIERDILKNPVLPIIGSDVIEVFGIKPGLRVKEVMETARKLYLNKPCNKQELMERLKEELSKNQP